MKKIISAMTVIAMLCSMFILPASAEEASYTFGNEYKSIKACNSAQITDERVTLSGTEYTVTTTGNNYNTLIVMDKATKAASDSDKDKYYPYGDDLDDNGFYLFFGAGTAAASTATIAFPEVKAGKYLKITYAKPRATNGKNTVRTNDNGDNTVTVGGETIDLKTNCEFDKWYSTVVKVNEDVSKLDMSVKNWAAIAVSEIKVLDSADTLELKAEDDVLEKYIVAADQTVQYEAKVYNSVTTLMGGSETVSRGTVDSKAAVTYSVSGSEGVSISGSGLLTITPAAQEGEITVKAQYNDIEKSLKLTLKKASDADGVKITGSPIVKKGDSVTLTAVPMINGTVMPARDTVWTISGDSKGCTINNGTLTVPENAQSGNITVKAELAVTGDQTSAGVSDTFTVTIQDSSFKAPYEIKGIFLKNCIADIADANGVDGVIVDAENAQSTASVIVRAIGQDGLAVNEVKAPVNVTSAGVSEVKAKMEFAKAVKVQAYIVNSDNEIVTDGIFETAKTAYRNVPIVSDWVTGEKSGLGMESASVINPLGVPRGVNPDTADTSTLNVKYTYDNDTYPAPSADNALWYKTGAYHAGQNSIYARDGVDWEQNALPIGNGYMGGMLFGLPDKDQIQINEETFWAAGYRGFQSKTKDALTVNPNMSEGINGYMSVGNIFVDFNMPANATVKNYYRDLNLDEAVAHVQYEYDGTLFKREYFASYPKGVMAFRYTADKANALNFTVDPISMHPGEVTVNDGEITITGKLKDSEPYDKGGNAKWSQESDLEYCTKIKVIADDGNIVDNYNSVTVSGATGVTILVTAATDYDKDQFELNSDGTVNMTKTPYKSVQGVQAAIDKANSRMSGAASMSYAELKEEHIKDYKGQFDTIKFSLTDDDEICDTPTDELQREYSNTVNVTTDSEDDPKQSNSDEKKHSVVSYDRTKYNALNKHLEELHYNYARYMMISSSRSDTMPATLQGKWCQSTAEIWGSCYCININLEMNYWFAGGANLSDSTKSLVNWMKSQIPAGTVTARNYYGVTPKSYTCDDNGKITFTDSAEDKDGVFIMHTKQAIMGTTDLTGSTNIQSAGNTAWLMYNLWDLYQTTGDKELLKKDIYPIMRKLANFYTQYLYENERKTTADTAAYPDGYYYTTWKGRSPEHGPQNVEGIKYDLQLVAGMYDYTIAAAKTLGVDDDKVKAWEEIRGHLETPVEIGEDGQIKEWKEEAKYGFDASGNQLGTLYHRHISHLVGMYPGTLINRNTPEWIEGAKVVLQKRGDGSTGWSTSNKFLLWARALDGDKALEIFRYQLAKKTYANLFDYHAPFQIDGNFGSAAGVMELLMQSQPLTQEQMNTQTAPIYLLPALPKAWDKGEISGIKAKNGAEVSVKWAEGRLTEATVKPAKNGDITLVYDNKEYEIKNAKANTVYTLANGEITGGQTEELQKTIELTKDYVKAAGYDEGVLIAAGYDENGALVKAKIIDDYEASLVEYDGCAALKAFVWNSINDMEPMGYKELALNK